MTRRGPPGGGSLEQFAASQCSTYPAHPSWAVALGTVPFEKSWFFFEHQGKRIGLAIHDPDTLEPLDEVLATFRLEAG